MHADSVSQDDIVRPESNEPAPIEVRLSNFLSSELAAIEAAQDTASSNQAAAFSAFLSMGNHLAAIKHEWGEAGGKAAGFNAWAEDHVLNTSKQWRNRLIQLSTNWAEIEPHVAHIEPHKRTVDGALAAWRKAKAAGAGGEGEESGEGGGEDKAPTIQTMSKADLRELAEDLAEVVRRFVAAYEAEDRPGEMQEAYETARGFLDTRPVLASEVAPAEFSVSSEGEESAFEDTQGSPWEEPETASEPLAAPAEAPKPLTKAARNRAGKLLRELDAAGEAGDADAVDTLRDKLAELASKHGLSPDELRAAVA